MRQNIQNWKQNDWRNRRMRRNNGEKAWFGVAIILTGVFLMLKKLGLVFFAWHTFWPILLIAIGIAIGFKKRFHGHAWWIMSLIGIAYSVPEFMIGDTSSSNLMLPLALIIGGLLMVLRPKNNRNWAQQMEVVTSNENMLNVDVTFGGRKEIVTSKEFKGGNISATFGGCEINMSQADAVEQPMILNVKVSFGGVELVVPSHWELQNEIEPTFGSVEDHRAMRTTASSISEVKKVLILKGNCSFGSIEIKSY
jgi:predicted membrane protein